MERVETEIVKASDPDTARKAAEVVLSGGIIVYPTETLYGIGGLALKSAVARRVSEVKQRPEGKPFSVLVGDMETLRRHFVISEKQADAYRKMLPLPLTLVLREKKAGMFPPEVSKDGQTAVRISGGEFARRLFEILKEPLISSSANISGSENPLSGSEAARIFSGKVELIVDYGNLPSSQGSAIVSLAEETPKILRDGDLEPEQLKDFLQWLS
ncbi:L-threonylcarbamoyladenylate synthase [Candidatus Mycalebacterium sp.]